MLSKSSLPLRYWWSRYSNQWWRCLLGFLEGQCYLLEEASSSEGVRGLEKRIVQSPPILRRKPLQGEEYGWQLEPKLRQVHLEPWHHQGFLIMVMGITYWAYTAQKDFVMKQVLLVVCTGRPGYFHKITHLLRVVCKCYWPIRIYVSAVETFTTFSQTYREEWIV